MPWTHDTETLDQIKLNYHSVTEIGRLFLGVTPTIFYNTGGGALATVRIDMLYKIHGNTRKK